mgnify:CR=1 FL=1
MAGNLGLIILAGARIGALHYPAMPPAKSSGEVDAQELGHLLKDIVSNINSSIFAHLLRKRGLPHAHFRAVAFLMNTCLV